MNSGASGDCLEKAPQMQAGGYPNMIAHSPGDRCRKGQGRGSRMSPRGRKSATGCTPVISAFAAKTASSRLLKVEGSSERLRTRAVHPGVVQGVLEEVGIMVSEQVTRLKPHTVPSSLGVWGTNGRQAFPG